MQSVKNYNKRGREYHEECAVQNAIVSGLRTCMIILIFKQIFGKLLWSNAKVMLL